MFLAVLFLVPKIRSVNQPIDEWVNKLTVYLCNIILLGNEKEQTINTHNNMDEIKNIVLSGRSHKQKSSY